jgi:hypothetical protein
MNITETVHELRFTRAQLRRLSNAELELLLRLGLAVNELMVFQRWLSSILASEPRTEALKDIWLAQVMTALMSLAGKVFEALEVFRTGYLQQPLGHEYQDRVSPDAEAAIRHLRATGGRNSKLADIRNFFSFHFHNGEQLGPYLDHLPDDAKLSLYAGLCDANTTHQFALEPFLTSLVATLGVRASTEAFDAIRAEIRPTLNAFHAFVIWFAEQMFEKMGAVERLVHHPDASDVGVIEQQRFITLVTPKPAERR